MSIIIVGNGTSITDNKNGHKIDSFDTVLRFNSFKIRGYEEYTGTKTNIWFTVNRAHIKNINDFLLQSLCKYNHFLINHKHILILINVERVR